MMCNVEHVSFQKYKFLVIPVLNEKMCSIYRPDKKKHECTITQKSMYRHLPNDRDNYLVIFFEINIPDVYDDGNDWFDLIWLIWSACLEWNPYYYYFFISQKKIFAFLLGIHRFIHSFIVTIDRKKTLTNRSSFYFGIELNRNPFWFDWISDILIAMKWMN